MVEEAARPAIYYPFHLCHAKTLEQLLNQHSAVHFRDFMALQITPMSGLTAFANRMADQFPELVESGRIVQGYSVSGPLDAEMSSAVDRDLTDSAWRDLFHSALVTDRRFQQGLFDLSHATRIGASLVPGPAALLRLGCDERRQRPYSLRLLQGMCARPLPLEDGYDFEYALALVKTSAALAYTIRLATNHTLEAVTDCESHSRLLSRTLSREGCSLPNTLVPGVGY